MFDQGQILPTMIRPVRDLPEGLAPKPGTSAPSLEDEHIEF